MAADSKLLPLRPPRRCPICGRKATRQAYPFCSKRCADIDLHRWLSGGYAVAGRDGEAAGGEDATGEAPGGPGSDDGDET